MRFPRTTHRGGPGYPQVVRAAAAGMTHRSCTGSGGSRTGLPHAAPQRGRARSRGPPGRGGHAGHAGSARNAGRSGRVRIPQHSSAGRARRCGEPAETAVAPSGRAAQQVHAQVRQSGSVRIGKGRSAAHSHRASAGGDPRRAGLAGTQERAAALIRMVRSCTWLNTSRSSFICLRILRSACMTVVWSRPPNASPILGSERSVSSRVM